MLHQTNRAPSPDDRCASSGSGWLQAALLALPLSGCLSSADRGDTAPAAIHRPEHEPPTTSSDFSPSADQTPDGIINLNGLVAPLLGPEGVEAAPLSIAEARVLTLLLSDQWADRYAGLNQLSDRYLPRLEPVLRGFLDDRNDSLIASRAVTLLALRGSEENLEALRGELATAAGLRLKRCVDVLRLHPTEPTLAAMKVGIRTGGFGEQEGRDTEMVIGKALATMAPEGGEFLRGLLVDPDPRMQVAGAVSLAHIHDHAALPVLLRYAFGEDSIVRRRALSALPEFRDRSAVLVPLEQALAEPAVAPIALTALQQIGAPALPVVAPYLNVAHFEASGCERGERKYDLAGVTYGAIVQVALDCAGALSRPVPTSGLPAPQGAALTLVGIPKLIRDLETPGRRDDANEALRALGGDVHPYIPSLVTNIHARELLLTYPPAVLYTHCSMVLSGSEDTAHVRSACHLIGETIRAAHTTETRQRQLQEIVAAAPEAFWIRDLIGFVWLEATDRGWVTAALQAVPTSTSAQTILAEASAAALVGIDVPFRWSSAHLAEIIRNRAALSFDERPIAALVYAESDHNGAFGQHNVIVEQLIRQGYCVRYYDVRSDRGALEAIQAAVTVPGTTEIKPAAVIILAAHSTRTEMIFGHGGDAASVLSLDDQSALRRGWIAETLEPGGQIILIACSAGEGRAEQGNIANMFRQLFVHAGAIWSSEVPDNLRKLVFDEAGKISDVDFRHKRVYRPSNLFLK